MNAAPAYEVDGFEFVDADEFLCAQHDFGWAVRERLLDSSENAWRAFNQGYRAGGEVGRRRYGGPKALATA